MKKILLCCMLVLLVGCQEKISAPTKTETIIDWVDFLKVNERQYTVLYTSAIADESYIGKEVGKVTFNVDKNITDPNYQVKEGDAAFLDEGTIIYEVQDMPDLVAVEDQDEINGYRIYQAEDVGTTWDFEHMRQDDIKKIEIQKGYTNPQLVKEFTEEADIHLLLDILNDGQERKDIEHKEEPELYHLVFYNERPVASHYPLFHEGDIWYWHPWEEEILPETIAEFIKNDK